MLTYSVIRRFTLTFAFFLMACGVAVAQQPADRPAHLAGTFALADQDRPGNVPAGVRQATQDAERTARRFRIGFEGGVGLDPELIMLGGHAAFGPLFKDNIEFRPGVELGFGEITTLLSINLDVFYVFPGVSRTATWTPYVGAGPAFGLSHRGFVAEGSDANHVDVSGTTTTTTGTTTGTTTTTASTTEDINRFNFSDTDFNGGVNFIAGARTRRGRFLELRATAWGVSNIRIIAGFNF